MRWLSLLPIGLLFGVFAWAGLGAIGQGLTALSQQALAPWGGFWGSLGATLSYAIPGALVAVGAGTYWAWRGFLSQQAAAPSGRATQLLLILPHISVGFLVMVGLDLVARPTGLSHSSWALVLALGLKEGAFVALMVTAVLNRLERRLIEVGRALGARPSYLFWQIFWPQLRPVSLTAGLLVGLYSLGAWELPYLFADSWPKPLSVLLYQAWSEGSPALRSAASGAAAVLFLLQFLLVGLMVWFDRPQRRWAW